MFDVKEEDEENYGVDLERRVAAEQSFHYKKGIKREYREIEYRQVSIDSKEGCCNDFCALLC